jgi:enoyl-CoA hydratase
MNPLIQEIDDYLLITLNRPEALNALSFSIIEHLAELFDQASKSKARALIITGAGQKAFCAGADIKELMGRSRVEQKRGAELGQRVFSMLEDLPMPSVALINGFAFGGGLELALACTFRLATPNAKMGLPEVKLGLIPGYGGTQRLTRAIGQTKANQMILTGQTIDAETALNYGILNAIITNEDPLSATKEFCKGFSNLSLPVLSFARSAILRAGDVGLQEGLQIEADLSTLAYSLKDAEEGMNAFAEKRPPIFKDC